MSNDEFKQDIARAERVVSLVSLLGCVVCAFYIALALWRW
tara:strand:- start:455 stop:574 length:120 start_codon:yes stop_codon:yes gene_type:complete